MDIKYIKHEDIDKTKWNSCVHFATNGNVFGYKWFLDNTTQEWDGLVEGDYESVMPLPFKYNWLKSKQLYQPSVLRELGVYSINALSPKRIEAFFDKIPADYKSMQMRLNEQMKFPENQGFRVKKLENYQLFLAQPYEELADKFDRELLLKLEEAEKIRLLPSNQLKPEKIAEFYKTYAPKTKETEENFHALQRIMWNAMHRGWGSAAGVLGENKELCAVNFFIYSHGKVLSFCAAESPYGKAKGALDFSFNMMLRSHAGRPSILDFNGRNGELALALGAQKNHYFEIEKKSWF